MPKDLILEAAAAAVVVNSSINSSSTYYYYYDYDYYYNDNEVTSRHKINSKNINHDIAQSPYHTSKGPKKD